MPHIKQISRSATVAYSPSGGFLALGTVAAAVDMSFSTSSTLEVVKMDFTTADKTMVPFGSPVGAAERFNRLAWGAAAAEGGDQPEGIIAGGLEDGSICLWDPVKIFNGSGESAQLAKLQKHEGSVKGLGFNTFSPNLLASGGGDGELCIWDLATPTQPSLYPALKNGSNQAASEITHLQWNNKVQHILASTSAAGSTVVWDLKRQRPVISFADPQSRRRCSSLQWNPEVATQLVVASDDDRSPVLQLWDLRNSVSPLKEFAGHTQGVLSMAWNIAEPSMMLSSGKDNRTLCWDMDHGTIITELPQSTNWNFEVTWSPTTPGIFATASFDGKVNVHNIVQCTGSGTADVVNEDFSVSQVQVGPAKPLSKAPKWLARPFGATFGFGGRLVSFTNGQKVDPNTSTTVPCATISTTQVVSDTDLIQRSEMFEKSIAGGETNALRDFCTTKGSAVADMDEKETWDFLRVLFEDDARRQLLTHLGFDTAPEVTQAAAAVEDLTVGDHEPPAAPQPGAAPGDGGDFFDQIPDQPAPQATDGGDFFDNLPTPPLSPAGKGAPAVPPSPGLPPNSPGPMESGETDILSALYVGNYEKAVAACLQNDRMADALVLASIGGAELWKSTQKEYMSRQPKQYMKVVEAVMDSNLAGLIRTRPLSLWKETLALLCTYARSDEWADLCSNLGNCLARSGNKHAATLCFICAGNVDKAVEHWSSKCESSPGVDSLQTVMEKAVVLGMATGQRTASPALGELVTRYADLLAAQGRMGTALEYLGMVPGEACMATAILKDRIFRSGARDIPATSAIPPFPYEGYDLKAQPSDAAAGSAAYGNSYAAQAQPQQAQQYQQYAQPSQPQQPQQPAYQYQQQQQQQYAQPAAAQGFQAPAQPVQPQAQPGVAYQQKYTQPNQGVSQASTTAPNPYATAGYAAQPVAPPPAVPQPVVFTPQSMAPAAQAAAPQAVPQPAVFVPQAPASTHGQPQAVQQPSQFMPQAPTSQRGPAPGAAAPQAAPAKPAAPPAPTGPPANISVQTADVSTVSPELKPVIESLSKLFGHCASVLPPTRKREMDDNSKRLGGLFWHANKGDVSPSVVEKLKALCQALDSGDLHAASHIQVQMTTTDWDECSQWLTALKRLIKTAQTGR